MRPSKWPNKIEKAKITLGNLKGYAWQDRWHENIWFETNTKLYTPLEFNRLYKKESISSKLNILHKIIYNHKIRDLIPDGIKLFNKLPKSDLNNIYNQPVILPLHGIKDEQ